MVVGRSTDVPGSLRRDASKPLAETGQPCRTAAALLPVLSGGDIPDYGDEPLWFHPLPLGPHSAVVLLSSHWEKSAPDEGKTNPCARVDEITQRRVLVPTLLSPPCIGASP